MDATLVNNPPSSGLPTYGLLALPATPWSCCCGRGVSRHTGNALRSVSRFFRVSAQILCHVRMVTCTGLERTDGPSHRDFLSYFLPMEHFVDALWSTAAAVSFRPSGRKPRHHTLRGSVVTHCCLFTSASSRRTCGRKPFVVEHRRRTRGKKIPVLALILEATNPVKGYDLDLVGLWLWRSVLPLGSSSACGTYRLREGCHRQRRGKHLDEW